MSEKMLWRTKKFFWENKKLLSYFIKLNEDRLILLKEYSKGCIVVGPNWQLSIGITHDKSTVSTNNRHWKVWTLDYHGILQSKDKKRGIIVSDFLFLWSYLNLAFLVLTEQKELAELNIFFEAATVTPWSRDLWSCDPTRNLARDLIRDPPTSSRSKQTLSSLLSDLSSPLL